MRAEYSEHFRRNYADAPVEVRRAFDKKLGLLMQDLRHPSLHAKKYDASQGLWQARINRDWRFYFTIVGDTYWLHAMIPHPK